MNRAIKDLYLNRWTVTTPIVYRYMHNEWIERFFKYGELRLTSYQKFRKDNLDEIRGDEQEGTTEYRIWNRNEDFHCKLQRTTGDRHYIFCTSQLFDVSLMNKDNFNCDGCFKIKNTTAFGNEIALKIKNYLYGNEGPAIYSPTGQVDIKTGDYGIEDFTKENWLKLEQKSMFEVFNEISERDNSIFFSKRDKYSYQKEYRLTWAYDTQETPDYIDIKVPNAVKYCEWLTRKKF